jgi:hypothetical protein
VIHLPAFDEYGRQLQAWLDGGGDESALQRAMVALSAQARAGGMPPEHIVISLQSSGLGARRTGADEQGDAARPARYADALHRMLESCTGQPQRLRLVAALDDRDWVVLHVREGMRWDPEIEMRRKDWLCCATTDDRRYITPVPSDWEQWTDAELLVAITEAKPDLRGPRFRGMR